jgi:hypothetical protein
MICPAQTIGDYLKEFFRNLRRFNKSAMLAKNSTYQGFYDGSIGRLI